MAYQPSEKHRQMMDLGREAAMLSQLGMVKLPDGRVITREQLDAMRTQAQAEAAQAQEVLNRMPSRPMPSTPNADGARTMDVKWRPARPGDAQPVLPPRSGDPYHKMPPVDSLGDIPEDMLVPPRKKRRTAQQQAMDALAALLGTSGPAPTQATPFQDIVR